MNRRVGLQTSFAEQWHDPQGFGIKIPIRFFFCRLSRSAVPYEEAREINATIANTAPHCDMNGRGGSKLDCKHRNVPKQPIDSSQSYKQRTSELYGYTERAIRIPYKSIPKSKPCTFRTERIVCVPQINPPHSVTNGWGGHQA